jgi:hypothetical protein
MTEIDRENLKESPCDGCHNYWLCMATARACSDFKLFYDTGSIAHHNRSPNWYIDMPPGSIKVRDLSERLGFGKETNKMKHWLQHEGFCPVYKLIEDPLGFIFIEHLENAIPTLDEGKSSKRLRKAKAMCSEVVLEEKARVRAQRENNMGRVVREDIQRTSPQLRSEEDKGEVRWGKLSEITQSLKTQRNSTNRKQ